jgi:hypothetical protein
MTGSRMADFWISAAIGLAFVGAAMAIVFGSYFLARGLLGVGGDADRTPEAAASIAVRMNSTTTRASATS